MHVCRTVLRAFVIGSLLGTVGCRGVDGNDAPDLPAEWQRESSQLFPGGVPLTAEGMATHEVTRIVDAITGRPLPGAEMFAIAEPRTPLSGTFWYSRKAVADADGFVRLRLDDLDERIDWLFFRAPGYAPRAAASAAPYPVKLRKGEDVAIEVRDAMDRPVAAAQVGLLLGCGHTPDVQTVTTDATGRAVLRGIDPGAGELWPVKPGLLSDYADVRSRTAPIVVRCASAPAARGTVVDRDGRPVAGAFVGSPHCHRGPWTQTDAAGRFVLAGAQRHGDLVVRDADGKNLGVFVGAALDTPRTLRLSDEIDGEEDLGPRTLTKIVTRRARDGEPAGAVPIVAVRDADGWHTTAMTDDEGVAELELPLGAHRLLIGEPLGRYLAMEVRRTVREDVEPPLPITLREHPKYLIETPGLPDGGQVFVVDEDDEREITEQVAAGQPVPIPHGCFLRLEHEGRVRVLRTATQSLAPGATLGFAWYPPATIHAEMVDSTGSPVAGWIVVSPGAACDSDDLQRARQRPAQSTVAAQTWRQGRVYAFFVPADASQRRLRVPVDLPSADGATIDLGRVTLREQRDPSIRVLLADGTPAAGARVAASRPGMQTSDELAADGTWDSDFIEPVAGDRFVFRHGDRLPLRVRLAGDGPWTLQWPAGHLDLDVRDPSGNAIERFTALLDDHELDGEHGTLAIAGVAAGTHRLIVVAAGRRAQVYELVLADGEARTLDTVLTPR